MNIISKEEAQRTGEKYYFTGKECSFGFIALRKVSDTHCQCEAHLKASCKRALRNRRKYSVDPTWIAIERDRSREKQRKRRANPAEKAKDRVEALARFHAFSAEEKLRSNELHRIWARNNTGKVLHYVRQRELTKKKQRCTCCTSDQLKDLYVRAADAGMEVDHINPLRLGGLHCVENLQLLAHSDHLAKTASDKRDIAAHRRSTNPLLGPD